MLFADGSGQGVRRSNLAGRSDQRRDLGQTKVENFSVPALGDEDVGGFHVAMDDALGVGRIQRIGNLNG